MYKTILIIAFTQLFIGCNDKEPLVDSSTNGLVDITSEKQFDDEVASGVSMVFFHASWCSKCAAQRPAVETVSEETIFSDVFFAEVEYEDFSDIVESRDIKGFPTIVIYKDNIEQKRFSGQGHSEGQIRQALTEATM